MILVTMIHLAKLCRWLKELKCTIYCVQAVGHISAKTKTTPTFQSGPCLWPIFRILNVDIWAMASQIKQLVWPRTGPDQFYYISYYWLILMIYKCLPLGWCTQTNITVYYNVFFQSSARGTVKDKANFTIEDDVAALRKAIEGIGKRKFNLWLLDHFRCIYSLFFPLHFEQAV